VEALSGPVSGARGAAFGVRRFSAAFVFLFFASASQASVQKTKAAEKRRTPKRPEFLVLNLHARLTWANAAAIAERRLAALQQGPSILAGRLAKGGVSRSEKRGQAPRVHGASPLFSDRLTVHG
jgi:hypothetical protein